MNIIKKKHQTICVLLQFMRHILIYSIQFVHNQDFRNPYTTIQKKLGQCLRNKTSLYFLEYLFVCVERKKSFWILEEQKNRSVHLNTFTRLEAEKIILKIYHTIRSAIPQTNFKHIFQQYFLPIG